MPKAKGKSTLIKQVRRKSKEEKDFAPPIWRSKLLDRFILLNRSAGSWNGEESFPSSLTKICPPILSDSHVGHEMNLKKKDFFFRFFRFSKPLLFPFSHRYWADRAAVIEPSAWYDLMILDALHPTIKRLVESLIESSELSLFSRIVAWSFSHVRFRSTLKRLQPYHCDWPCTPPFDHVHGELYLL